MVAAFEARPAVPPRRARLGLAALRER